MNHFYKMEIIGTIIENITDAGLIKSG